MTALATADLWLVSPLHDTHKRDRGELRTGYGQTRPNSKPHHTLALNDRRSCGGPQPVLATNLRGSRCPVACPQSRDHLRTLGATRLKSAVIGLSSAKHALQRVEADTQSGSAMESRRIQGGREKKISRQWCEFPVNGSCQLMEKPFATCRFSVEESRAGFPHRRFSRS